jgi:hypothetical protein
MFRFSLLVLASKASGGAAKNQGSATRRKYKQFGGIIGEPISTKEKLKEQRSRFGQTRFSRVPEYFPGNNVTMTRKQFTLYAKVNGVMTVRPSIINPRARKWVDVEPDIQKVYRSRQVRGELDRQERASPFVESNKHYKNELQELREPRWRDRVMNKKSLAERFVDPNLFSRGLVPALNPLDRYCYE